MYNKTRLRGEERMMSGTFQSNQTRHSSSSFKLVDLYLRLQTRSQDSQGEAALNYKMCIFTQVRFM